MMEYLGSIGRLVGLKCASDEAVSRADRYRLQTSANGVVRAQVVPRIPRQWAIRAGVLPDRDLAAVEGFVSGEFGVGPWHWVSIAAQHGNMLTPDEALCLTVASSSLAAGGPVVASDGTYAGRSIHRVGGSGWVATHRGIPVLPGRAVSWAADVAGDGQSNPQLSMSFHDSAGGFLSQVDSGIGERHAAMQRLFVTAVAPPGAATVTVGVRTSVQVLTRPQVTWLDHQLPWTTGKGCRSAVPVSVESDILISFGKQQTLNNLSVLIQEVGV